MQKKYIPFILVQILFSGSFLQALHNLPTSFFRLCLKVSKNSFVDHAVNNDDEVLFAKLLAAGLPMHTNDNALLQRIARQRKKNIFTLLLNNDYYRDALDKNGQTMLIHAIIGSSPTIVRTYLNRYKEAVHKYNSAGRTPLHCAAGKGGRRIAQLLIDQGALLDFKNNQGETPLLYAAKHNKLRMIQFLIKCGADKHARNITKKTLLLLGAQYNNTKVVEYAVENGHSPFEVDDNDMTACMYAADNNNCQMIKVLALHANPSVLSKKNKEGFTALDIARFAQNSSAEILLTCLHYNQTYQDIVDQEIDKRLHTFFTTLRPVSNGTYKKTSNAAALLMHREISGKVWHTYKGPDNEN